MTHRTVRFASVLFDHPVDGHALDPVDQSAIFKDLNLDQVFAELTSGRQEYDLAPFFSIPLHDVASVRYRHEVLRDLENEGVADAIGEFARRMQSMRKRLEQAEGTHYRYQAQRWQVDAVDVYCDAVASLRDDLDSSTVTSRGLRGLIDYLAAYTDDPRFHTLVGETRGVLARLAGIRYTVLIRGDRVTVSRYDDEADYTSDVEETFAKFRRGDVEDHLVKLRSSLDMDHVEAQVLDRVAQLFPEPFEALADLCDRHRNFVDKTIGRFDREVQFYLAYLEFIEPLEKAGSRSATPT